MGLDDGGYKTPYIDVDVQSIEDAATVLTNTSNGLVRDVDTLMGKAILPLDGFPEFADVYSAYAFWWGRWSKVVEEAEPALRGCATVAAGAAGGFTRVDEEGVIDLTLPANK